MIKDPIQITVEPVANPTPVVKKQLNALEFKSNKRTQLEVGLGDS